MRTIYKPKGRAGEYSPLALNLYQGCDHDCDYCYVKNMRFLDHTNQPKPRAGIIEALELYCSKHKITEQVLLSFTGDLYCKADEKYQLTRKALEILAKYNVPTAILTKGGRRCLRDFDLFEQFDEIKIGMTLVFDNQKDTEEHEPGSAGIEERIETLQLLHANGVQTWVSFEPVFDMYQTLNLMGRVTNFVDEFKIGKLNYVKNDTDWILFKKLAVNFCEEHNQKYYIKKDLQNEL